jgi:hypothetical protein
MCDGNLAMAETLNNAEPTQLGIGAVSSSAFVNREGIVLKVGMKVKGFITYQRSYMRTGDKDITGTIVSKHGRLYVNSDSEPEKNYPLSKFAHNWLTQNKIAWLDVL